MVTTVMTFSFNLLFTKPSAHTHAHTSKWPFLNNTAHVFSAQEEHVGDGVREDNRERETNLKGIDFLILMNTFPLLN